MRTDRQADRHDKANGRFSIFCERAFKKSGTEVDLPSAKHHAALISAFTADSIPNVCETIHRLLKTKTA
jgi:hypothetical protein